MPFDTPTLPVLVGRAADDLAASALRQSDAEVMARVHAGAAYGLYGYLDWIAAQILPDTADEETLERQALLRLKVPRIAAVAASGAALFTGAAGALLPAGALLQHTDGRRYQLVADVTLAGSSGTAELVAVDAGAVGNLGAGEALSLVSPVVGVADAFTVAAGGLAGGVDQESVESLRQRVIRSYRVIAHGGDADDYVTWAGEVSGVTRAWCVRRWMGPGTVGVFVMRDDDPDPFPDAAALAEVEAYIQAERPVTAELYVLAPVAKPVTFQLSVTPNTPAVRAAVERALAALIDSESDLGGSLLWTHIHEAISSAEGETDHTLLSPSADVTAAANELITYGGVTWL
ncbi:baseplate J protein [Azoarcus indigens]|uniref:Putative phage protein gp47/JayE n=1 Tax=Azoarcus indigens TaxID=29545 RepID=A0A4R6DZQ7_9RHOO|nr:baseplate J/gp47 family protein [Azoarcus indigens]NMG64876.1 baseplate J protein [Azoarcus indigens]TDN50414.1 putative phage protein gp47/JayE [Azoarcus indigens]